MATRQADASELVRRIRELEPYGWRVRAANRNNSVVVTTPGPTHHSVTIHLNSGGPQRSITNTIARLNRLGMREAVRQLQQDQEEGRVATVANVREAAERKIAQINATASTGRAAAAKTRPSVAAPVPFTEAAPPKAAASGTDAEPPARVAAVAAPVAPELVGEGVYSQVELMTPQRAAELAARPFTATLADGTKLEQRRFKPPWHKQLCDFIAHGQWMLTNEGVGIARDGSVLDGQHRLCAIRDSGKTVPILVTYNLDPACFPTLNTGLTRTGGDVLRVAGYLDTNALASTVKLLVAYDRWHRAYDEDPEHPPTPWQSWNRLRLVGPDLVEAVRSYGPELPRHLQEGRNIARPAGLVVASVAAFRYLAARAWPAGNAQLDTFCANVQTGAQLDVGDPALTLRNWAAVRAPRGGVHRRELMLLALLKCWNAYAAGGELRQFRYSESEPMPRIYAGRGRRTAR